MSIKAKSEMKPKEAELIQRVVKVFLSCKTFEQNRIAIRYMVLAARSVSKTEKGQFRFRSICSSVVKQRKKEEREYQRRLEGIKK